MTARLGRGRLLGLVRDLSRGADQVLAGLVVEQLAAAAGGAALARRVAEGSLAPGAARALMAEVEHDGDARRAMLVRRLHRSLTSPIDREDMFRLSRSADDVLDALRDFVREVDLFGAPPHPAYAPVLASLADGIDHLAEAVRLLPTMPRAAADRALRAKKQGVRLAYQQAVAGLFGAAPSAEMIKTLLLLARLDVAGGHLAAAADALADGVVKRFQ